MNIAVVPFRCRLQCDVAVIGAGPYGLAAAAHLRAAGLEVRVFGEPMSFWRHHMPEGMKIRSPWQATHIADPQAALTLDRYFLEAGLARPTLLPLAQFVDYGLWFQNHAVPDLDQRQVVAVDAADDGFRLALADGEIVAARRVIMATGLLGHEYRPAAFAGLPRELVFHSCEHGASAPYRGKRVAVIGRGQSACESAALLHEAGAEVEIISRGHVEWNADPQRRGVLRRSVRAALGQRLIPPSQVGPFPLSWLNEAPGLIHSLPSSLRARVNETSLRPTAITWLRERIRHVPMLGGQRIRQARRAANGVVLELDGASRQFDHVVLATGYRFSVDRVALLAPRLRGKIVQRDGLPVLDARFESSVPGLHFLGAAAVGSFGPLLRFIAGAGFAARRVTRAAARGRRATAPSLPLAALAEHD